MTSERQPETIMERYLRLKEEVQQFATDVQHLAETRTDSEKLLDISPSDLLNDVSPGSGVMWRWFLGLADWNKRRNFFLTVWFERIGMELSD